MEKTKNICFVVLFTVLFFVSSAHATLELRGTDANGNRLIYDTDFNITWYDYTNDWNNWQTQMNWASALSVSGGDLVGVYDDWRLPTALNQNGTGPCIFFDCTGSEMGHLYYIDLGNIRFPLTGYGLKNKGDFQNLQPTLYWSGTMGENSQAWTFNANGGRQSGIDMYADVKALAVRSGDVAVAPPVVPEPISSILFISGGAILAGKRLFKRKA